MSDTTDELKEQKAQAFRDFMHAVTEMRAAQKFYFKNRTRPAQNISMQWEREVDRLLVVINDLRKGKPQVFQEKLL